MSRYPFPNKGKLSPEVRWRKDVEPPDAFPSENYQPLRQGALLIFAPLFRLPPTAGHPTRTCIPGAVIGAIAAFISAAFIPNETVFVFTSDQIPDLYLNFHTSPPDNRQENPTSDP